MVNELSSVQGHSVTAPYVEFDETDEADRGDQVEVSPDNSDSVHQSLLMDSLNIGEVGAAPLRTSSEPAELDLSENPYITSNPGPQADVDRAFISTDLQSAADEIEDPSRVDPKFVKMTDEELLTHIASMKGDGGRLSEMREAATELVGRFDRRFSETDRKSFSKAFGIFQKAFKEGKWTGTGSDGKPVEEPLTTTKRDSIHRAILGDLNAMTAPIDVRLEMTRVFYESRNFKDAEKWLLEAKQKADSLPIAQMSEEIKLLADAESKSPGESQQTNYRTAALELRGGFWPSDIDAAKDTDDLVRNPRTGEIDLQKSIAAMNASLKPRRIAREALENISSTNGIINYPATVRAQLAYLYLGGDVVQGADGPKVAFGQNELYKPVDAYKFAQEASEKFAEVRALLNTTALDPKAQIKEHPLVMTAFKGVREVFSNPKQYWVSGPQVAQIRGRLTEYFRTKAN